VRAIVSNLLQVRSPLRRRRGAFSLIEVLVVVGLLAFIILGLMMMFSQVQRAYKLGTTQVDVLESGRMVVDQLNRELVQVTPSRGSNSVNFYTRIISTEPLLQQLSGTPGAARTNMLSALFFLTRENQRWTGIGYLVSDTNNVGMGTLFRYETNAPYGQNPAVLFASFTNAPLNQMSRLVDGVVQFKTRSYDTNGVWLNDIDRSNLLAEWPRTPALFGVGEMEYYSFSSNAIPAAVEVEFGVLEDATLAKARAYPTALTRRNFLTNQVNSVHVFRTRVSLRNVDPLAYQ